MNNLLKTTMLAALALTLGVMPAVAEQHVKLDAPVVTTETKVEAPAVPALPDDGDLDEKKEEVTDALKDGTMKEGADVGVAGKIEEKK